MPEPGVIDVAAALVFRGGLLLITRRPHGKHLAGLWEFPGGKLAPGESWEHALARELLEEVDLRIAPGRLYEEVVHAYPEKTVRLRFFVCTAHDGGEPRPIECEAVAWVGREGLARHEFPPADARLLKRLLADDALWVVDSGEA